MRVHLLLARTFAPLDERKEAAVARLMAIPEYFESVKPNLQQVPPVLLAASMETGGARARRSWTTWCARCCGSSRARPSAWSTRAIARAPASCAFTTGWSAT